MENNEDDPFAVEPVESEETELTADEKQKVIDSWNSGETALKAIIEAACGQGVDGRSKKGIAVKQFIASTFNKMARPAQVPKRKMAGVSLTEANKEFIKQNASSMKLLEMTRLLFNNNELSPLSSEFRVVREYFKTLDPASRGASEDENVSDYNPPQSEAQALARVNKYVYEGLDGDNLTPHQKDWLKRLKKYMHTPLFLFEMGNLQKQSERTLFESSFVKFTYNKPDLTEEDIDLYIRYCGDMVKMFRMQQEEIQLIEFRDDVMAETNKIPLAVVEAIAKLRTNVEAMSRNQKKILEDLNTKRSERVERQTSAAASVINLVENFKEKTRRDQILELIKARQTSVKAEIDKLRTMDDLRVQVLGLREDEIFL